MIKLGSVDVESDDQLFEALGRLGGMPGAGSVIVPLLAGGRREGVLCALGVGEMMRKVEPGLLDGIASPLGTIRDRELEHERLAEEAKILHHEARTDLLTGLLNRRGFMVELERNFEHSQTLDFSDVLLLSDVEGLKEADERHGYGVGDQLLIDVGHALAAAGCLSRRGWPVWRR